MYSLTSKTNLLILTIWTLKFSKLDGNIKEPSFGYSSTMEEVYY
jgi:hypothetical protein